MKDGDVLEVHSLEVQIENGILGIRPSFRGSVCVLRRPEFLISEGSITVKGKRLPLNEVVEWYVYFRGNDVVAKVHMTTDESGKKILESMDLDFKINVKP